MEFKAAAALSLAAALAALSAPGAAAQGELPDWVRQSAGWWAAGEVDDMTFLAAIEFLINNGLITLDGAAGMGAGMPERAPGTATGAEAGAPVAAGPLTIGFIPVEKADELTPKAEALEAFLERELGSDVELVIPTNYETIIEGMRFGHIDAAFMDTGPAWIAHERTGAEAVLAELVGGKVNYQATVWVLADDDSIQSVEDTLGKRVAFTSITGSSGFVRPVGTLVTGGQIQVGGDDIVALEAALAENFEAYTFAGGYKAALELLLNGNVDAAFGSDIAPSKYLEPEDIQRLRAADVVGPVPSHVFMVSADMPGPVRDALVDALVRLNYDGDNHILRSLYGAEALVPTTTALHIGDFGSYISALAGLDQLILDKYDKGK